MSLKSIVLAGVTAMSLAAPAVAFAQPYWDQDRGYHNDDWRRHQWRERERWEHRGYSYGYGPRCFIEDRGYYAWNGRYVSRPVRVCR